MRTIRGLARTPPPDLPLDLTSSRIKLRRQIRAHTKIPHHIHRSIQIIQRANAHKTPNTQTHITTHDHSHPHHDETVKEDTPPRR